MIACANCNREVYYGSSPGHRGSLAAWRDSETTSAQCSAAGQGPHVPDLGTTCEERYNYPQVLRHEPEQPLRVVVSNRDGAIEILECSPGVEVQVFSHEEAERGAYTDEDAAVHNCDICRRCDGLIKPVHPMATNKGKGYIHHRTGIVECRPMVAEP